MGAPRFIHAIRCTQHVEHDCTACCDDDDDADDDDGGEDDDDDGLSSSTAQRRLRTLTRSDAL